MKKIPKEIKKIIVMLQNHGHYAGLTGEALFNILLDREEEIKKYAIVVDATKKDLENIFSKSLPDNVHFICCADAKESWPDRSYISAYTVLYDGTSFVDPHNGKQDIEEERIDVVPGKEDLLKDPLKILDAILEIGKTDFELSPKMEKIVRENLESLNALDKRTMAEQFQQIMAQPFTGRALRTMERCGLMRIIVGERIWRTRNRHEKKALEQYMKNIGNTLPIMERRVVSFYLGFWKKRDMRAMKNLDFKPELVEKLKFTHKHLPELFYIRGAVDLKDFLYKYGMESYTFLDNVSKIQAKVYNLDTRPIATRFALLRSIAANNEPVFLEDLSMKAQVLIDEGLAKDWQEAEELLNLLVYIVHRHPDYNEPRKLLSQVYRLNHNPLRKLRCRLYGKKF